MVRAFLYMVLTVLVLQLGWRSVAAYCEHETRHSDQHLGHHAAAGDAHQEVLATSEPPPTAAADSLHSHCASCFHIALSHAALPQALTVSAPARFAPPLAPIRFSSSDMSRPERPQWFAAA